MAYLPNVGIIKSTSPVVIGRLTNQTAQTTISAAITAGDTTISVTSGTGIANGNIVFLVHPTEFYIDQFKVLSGGGTTTLTVDTPSGNDYDNGTTITAGNDDFSVDGSVTPVKFNFKTGIESIPARALISRILIVIETSTVPEIGQFGDITALTNGIYLRQVNSTTNTFFNIKTNLDFASVGFDFDDFPTDATANKGIRVRITFTRMGSYLSLDQNEDVELWVQDNLTGLVRAYATIEGVIE